MTDHTQNLTIPSRGESIRLLTPEQAQALGAFSDFYSDTLQTRAVRQRLMNFTIAHEGAAKGGIFKLTGVSGVGKTTVLRQYALHDFPELTGKNESILFVIVPENCSPRALAVTILDAMEDPAVGKAASRWDLTLRIHRILGTRRYRAIILDECQHMLEKKSSAVIMEVTDWLKTVVERTGIPLILSGLPEVSSVIDGSPQLRRRVIGQLELHAFDWNDKNDRMDFRSFLRELDRGMPLKPVGLEDAETARKFHYVSNGKIGLVWKLIRLATEKAMLAEDEGITARTLSEAFEELRDEETRDKQNVFA